MACTTRKSRWLVFTVSLVAVAGFVVAAHKLSPYLPGPAGAVFRQNLEQNIDATALFYTESGDVRDYLDPIHGKYSRSNIKGE